MENLRCELRKNLFLIVSPDKFDKILSGSAQRPEPESLHHIRNVLRKSGEISAFISCGDGRILAVRVDAKDSIQSASEQAFLFLRHRKVSLISPGIMRKNLEYMIKKSAELGIDKMSFISSDFQNYPVEKANRYEKIVLNACEQSRNPWFPELETLNKKIYDFPFRDECRYIWGDPDAKMYINEIQKDDFSEVSEICFINGPEGGWSLDEEIFLKNRFRSVRLSDNVLRAETAAIVAISYFKLLV